MILIFCRSCFVFVLSSACFGADGAGWKAGTARANITPTEPMWLAGYGSRTNVSDGKVMDLWIKALALEDAKGHRAVILTSDLLGIPQSIYQHSCAELRKKFKLKPDQIILSASHSHCTPVVDGALNDVYPLNDEQRKVIKNYAIKLEGQIVETVGQALADLAPARLAGGQGTADFAVNRRENPEKEVPKLRAQGALKGPTDHSVPVLAVYLPDGKLKAVLFGYACHNTVMSYNKWSGDYAGFAQLALEKNHPETTAMFFMGCGGDQNPLPRNRQEFAENYGKKLAAGVESALALSPKNLSPELKTSLEMVTLPLGPLPSEAELEKLTANKAPGTHRWAERMLSEQKAGKTFIRDYPFPVQAWKFGGEQLLVTLGGEPVVDYALKFKKEFGAQTWVAGYCNDVMNYIPTRRVLDEDKPGSMKPGWGYEGSRATTVYGLPALRWGDEVEDLITASAKRVVEKAQ